MYLRSGEARDGRQLTARDGDAAHNIPMGLGIGIAAAILIVALPMAYLTLRRLRMNEREPRALPGKFLKRQWWKWKPGRRTFTTNTATITHYQSPSANTDTDPTAHNDANGDVPQRGQSVRSTITLPSYSMLPKEEEQVIAREGERGGMDMVIEFPETVDEEETRREEEMESLYQIRLRRREEIAEREARRRQRREAQAAGDYARLQQISRETIAAREAISSSGTSASAMLAEHQARGRHQRISSVSYAELGEVRHDGSRIRANSAESEQRPLLSDPRHSTHSINTTHSQATSSVSGPPGTGGESPPEAADGDLSMGHIPPPHYDDYDDWGEAPAYESPIAVRREHSMHLLPQIRIDAGTPANSTPVTPATDNSGTPDDPHAASNTTPQSGITVIHQHAS